MDESVSILFEDDAWIQALVHTEVALARAQSRQGVIPSAAARTIATKARTFRADQAALSDAIRRDGFPIIGLVRQLRCHVGSKAAAWVHWGATTQDILDTALVTRLATAIAIIDQRVTALSQALVRLADKHRGTVMIARTHLQPAAPTSFGLKAAGWLAPFNRHRQRLAELRPRVLVVSCGGAAGTLASLGRKGPGVTAALARELGLGVPSMPWHTQRDGLQELAAWLSLIGRSTEKFAQDILLLAQAEVGEVQESKDASRGGSSAMPQKRNPILSETILVAARAAAAEFAALHAIGAPEHERGTTGGQLEFLHLPRLCGFVAGALRGAAELASGLQVDQDRMRANLAATHGTVLAETMTLALSRHVPVAEARALVRAACATALAEKRDLADVVRSQTKTRLDWVALRDPSRQLGSANAFIDRVVAETARLPSPPKQRR